MIEQGTPSPLTAHSSLLTEVFNAKDTAPLGIEAILKAGSYDLGPKSTRIEQKFKESMGKKG
jgi:hypothetical protein